jgi:hypothetical protein
MTAPSGYLRSLSGHLRKRLEEQTARRLSLAKALREAPDATNVQLATMFGVSRNTIQLDREAIMEQLQNATKNETELLRDGLVKKLEGLIAEVELHRKDGKLSLGAIDQVLSITKAVIELTGARKPVIEKLDVRHKQPIQFNTIIVPTGSRASQFAKAEMIKEPLTLEAGDPND